jgi:hypothetical protein
MKINVDKAIEILKDYIELDRQIREGDTESDYSKFCEEKCLSIESLIEYIFASRCAFKTSSVISKQVKEVEDTKVVQLTETDLKKMLACLTNCVFVADDGYISDEQRLKLIDYNYDILYKICDSLGIVFDDTIIDIDTLEIEELS